MDAKCEILFLCVYFLSQSLMKHHPQQGIGCGAYQSLPKEAAIEGDFSEHKHLKPAGKPFPLAVVWSTGSVFCHQPQSQGSPFWGSVSRDAGDEETTECEWHKFEQLYFSVVTSQKAVPCSPWNEGRDWTTRCCRLSSSACISALLAHIPCCLPSTL